MNPDGGRQYSLNQAVKELQDAVEKSALNLKAVNEFSLDAKMAQALPAQMALNADLTSLPALLHVRPRASLAVPRLVNPWPSGSPCAFYSGP